MAIDAQTRAKAAERWWDLMQQDQYGIATGNIGWGQMSPEVQNALTAYFNDTLAPKLAGVQKMDIWGQPIYNGSSDGGSVMGDPLAYSADDFAGLEDIGTVVRGGDYLPKLTGYDKRDHLPQTAQLYAINPQLAESMGITYERALADANSFGEQYNTAQEASDSADSREGWLMALGTIGAGVGGAYMNGTLNGAAPAASASDAATASQLMTEYGGQGASYGGSGVGTMEGLGTAGYEAGAANAFNLGNTLGEGGLPGTLSPNSYWNPVTQSEMPYGEVGSTPMTDTPWYEKLINNVVDNPNAASTLAKSLLSFATTPTQGGSASGLSGLSGLGGGSGGASGGVGSSGASSSPTITPQQLANPQFTKWDSPLGVQYKSINPLDNSSLAQALRSY